ncbi:scarecrow-like protein 3 [Lycium ferocissimum]|uniref:scarecrow-like protein 3 n=1 Tax=Lycium ferocissimum TaxID=112874 RepID=UPI0028167B1D|nr:scarecrow-like protein 3 [Lycium ferocissimum]
MNFSSPAVVKPDVTLSLTLSSTTTTISSTTTTEERGVKLIQLLLTCANHASSGNIHHADACLSQILQLASINGDFMQRLAAWFASSLAIRLVKRWPGLYKALNHQGPVPSSIVDLDRPRIIFAKAFPYMGFAYAVINKVLIQGMSEERMIHIVDLGYGDPKLWVPFLKNVANSPNGPPHLTITCVNNNKSMLEEMSMSVKKEAETLDIPFQFNLVNVSLRDLSIDMIKVKQGESLAIVSVLNLHVLLAEDDRINSHFGLNKNKNSLKDCKRMSEFLAMLHSFSPKLLILGEQEADHNLSKLVDRFVEGLNYYSALFDSIDTTLGRSYSLYEERVAVEQMLGKEIENIVACEGLEREERHERFGKWIVRLTSGGFRPVRLWYDIMEDAKRLAETYGADGYKIITQRGSLMICWHDRPIYSVSAWTAIF